MGSIQDEWAADAGQILNEIPKAVTVQKASGLPVSFNVLMTDPMVQQDLETGGFLDSAAFDVKFLKADVLAHPGVVIYGNLVSFNGKQYRIVAINDRPPSAWVIVKVQTKVGPAS
jgi:hypothetical protein